MLDRYEIWHALLTLVAVGWLLREPATARRIARDARVWLLAGALVPLADYVVPLVAAPDSIAFLVRERPLHSVLHGLVLAGGAALAAGFLVGSRRAVRLAGWALAGFATHLVLDWSAGRPVWLGLPDAGRGLSWSAFDPGHVPLLMVMAAGLAVRELAPRWARSARVTVLVLAGLYALGGAVQFGVVRLQAGDRVAGHGPLSVAPVNPWRTRWIAVAHDTAGYRVAQLDGLGGLVSGPEPIAAADQAPELIARLGDATVRAFVLGRFRHPVADVTRSETGLTLTLQEAADRHIRREGATFTLRTALDERERIYRVENFD